MTVFIGCADMSASHAGARFWAHDSDRVLARLLLHGADADRFEADLAASLAPRGLILNTVCDVAEITQRDSPEIREVAQAIPPNEPHLFGRICDVTKPRVCAIGEMEAAALVPSQALWAVLDGVAWPGLPEVLAGSGDAHASLYASTDAGTLASGPWLVHLPPGCTMLERILAQPHDGHVGILLTSGLAMGDLRRHLRRFTMAHIPTDATAPVYFRFYDPRVMLEMSTALSGENMSRFMAPIGMVCAPISPRTILPDHARIARMTTPFDTVEGTAGRIATITLARTAATDRKGPFYISSAEFARFEGLQRKKAEHGLARTLSREFPDRPWADYRRIGRSASAAGRRFGLPSVKQTSVLARAMMLFGPAFWDHHPDAAVILNDAGYLPWQKKDALVDWMVEEGTRPQGAAPAQG